MARKSKKQLEDEKHLTKSGRYRVQQAYYDDEGNRRVKSFTADTYEDAKLKASLWKKNNNNAGRIMRIKAADAVEKYIDTKRSVLSPATVRGYMTMYNTHIKDNPIGRIPLDQLTTMQVQIWVSTMASLLTPKSVRNIYMLFNSAVTMFDPKISFSVTLPPRKKSEGYCPSDADIKLLIDKIREDYGEKSDLEIAVMLAAFGTLRRGEICALESDDVSDTSIHVRRSMVRGEYGTWIVKDPKTLDSNRVVELPAFVMDLLKAKKGRIIDKNPDGITHAFSRVVQESGLPHFRFHDLRHYSASIMHAIGVPDQYIMARGGWSSDNVMKSVYRNVIDIEQARQTLKINTYFADNFS